jgi:diguanylate cyclase (GGDEF)-like protein
MCATPAPEGNAIRTFELHGPVTPFPHPSGRGRRVRTVPDPIQSLTTRLQTTLELDQLLDIFWSAVKAGSHFRCAEYRDPDGSVRLRAGSGGPHSVRYDLVINNQALGQVSFAAARRFSEGDLGVLEAALAALLYPLRNALLFRRVLEGSLKDPLTGVGNRAAFQEALLREIAVARRQRVGLGLIIVDADRFKEVNDRYGHLSGDCVLLELVRRVNASLRETDMSFRYGGDEFVALLTAASEQGRAQVSERIHRAVRETPFVCSGRLIRMTISIGGARLVPEDSDQTLFARADASLYEAKQGGRDCWRISDPAAPAPTH